MTPRSCRCSLNVYSSDNTPCNAAGGMIIAISPSTDNSLSASQSSLAKRLKWPVYYFFYHHTHDCTALISLLVIPPSCWQVLWIFASLEKSSSDLSRPSSTSRKHAVLKVAQMHCLNARLVQTVTSSALPRFISGDISNSQQRKT